MAEGLIQVTERFLGCTLGDLIHPSILDLFQAIQFAMQVYGRGRFARCGIGGDFAPKPPVVGEAGTAGVFAAEGLLRVVQL